MCEHPSLSRLCLTPLLLCFAVSVVGQASETRDLPDPRYYDYDEVVDLFDTWESQYPGIFHRESIGRTRLGEPIWAARISDNAALREPEPAVFFHGAQHSNEPNGTNAIIFMIDRLLTGYGKDATYTAMVDNLECWFVPIVNVDGHRLVFRGVEGWRNWRRNARDNDHNGVFTFPQDGVDLNRNWDHRWAEYDSIDFRSYAYKGPYPFSEPEVVALRDFILRERPVFVVDYHSPGKRTYPNMIFWPWLERGPHRNGPDAPHYRPISQGWASRTLTEIDTLHYNGDWYSYDTLPKEQCWIYKNTGICIFLMEISTQFWWEGAIVDTIAARVGRGSFYLMERALSGPGVKGSVTDAETGMPVVAEVRVAEAHDPKIGPRITDDMYGQYWRFLNPGIYNVTVLADGYKPVTEQVRVFASNWTTYDVALKAHKPCPTCPKEYNANYGKTRNDRN